MKPFALKISSPDGDLFNDMVTGLYARGTEGAFAVLADHVPFVTALVACECKIELEDGTHKVGKTQGGLLTVSKDMVILLSGSFEWI